MQDASKNIDIDIMSNSEKANIKCRSSKFRGRQILDRDTIAISSTPASVSRRMAFAVGFSILEFSKLEMYQVSGIFVDCYLPPTNSRHFYPKLSRVSISQKLICFFSPRPANNFSGEASFF